MITATIDLFVTLEKTICCACGITFAAPKDFLDGKRSSKTQFYCPNGHTLSWEESTEDRLRAQLAAEQRRVEYLRVERGQISAELRSQKFKTMAERGAKIRLKRRVANGVCPCCRRTFSNLQRHMAHVHPESLEKTEAQ